MKAIISFFVLIAQFFMSLFVPFHTKKVPDTASSFIPVLRFEVMSDTHVTALGDSHCNRIQKAMTLAYSDAENNKEYKSLDAVIFAGDLTDKGMKTQFSAFKGAVDSVLKEETKVLEVIHKSHDCNTMGRQATLDLVSELFGLPNDWHEIINGYHFIGISTCRDNSTTYNEEQRTWLRQQLEQAVGDDPAKPVFVFHHEHVFDTVYGSSEQDGWGQNYFADIFGDYPQIVHFSGHSHYPLNDPRSVWQGKFTAIGTGTLNYAEFTLDGKNTVHPDNYKDIAQCWIIEVDAENRVRARGFDALSAALLCEYEFDGVLTAENAAFTPAQQEARSSAPAFPKDAALKISGAGNRVKITVPAAESTDGNIIFAYRVRVYDENGSETDSAVIINDYWRVPTYDEVTLTVNAPKGSTVKATAENAYGQLSDPLTAKR